MSVTAERLARGGGSTVGRKPRSCPGLQQLLPGRQLHARAAERLAGTALGRVDRLPAGVVDVLAPCSASNSSRDSAPPCAGRAVPARGVLEQQVDGLGRVLLVRADHAARAALDPAGDVGALGADHPAAVVRDRPAAARRRARPAAPRPCSRRCAGRSPAGITSSSPVGRATIRPSSSTSSLRTTSTASTRSPPRIATGETRKRRTIRGRLPAGGRAANSSERARSSSERARDPGRGPRARGVERQVARVHDHVGARELAELLQLGGVNAACTGPRRPSIDDLLDAGPADRVDRLGAVVSVGASSSGVSASIRAQSIATFPLPITTARSCERSNTQSW